jgi:hypothetical protein
MSNAERTALAGFTIPVSAPHLGTGAVSRNESCTGLALRCALIYTLYSISEKIAFELAN